MSRVRLPKWIRERRYARQRAERGWSDADAWSFDDHLATVIAGGTRQLARNGYGYPFAFEQPDDEDGTKAMKAWTDVLTEISDGFQWYADNHYLAPAMDPSFPRAMELFAKYFRNLWD